MLGTPSPTAQLGGGSPLRNRTPVAKPLQDTAAPSLPCIPTTAKHKRLLAAPGLTLG